MLISTEINHKGSWISAWLFFLIVCLLHILSSKADNTYIINLADTASQQANGIVTFGQNPEMISLTVADIGKLTIPSNATEPARYVVEFARAAVRAGFDLLKEFDNIKRIHEFFCVRMACSRRLLPHLIVKGVYPQLVIYLWQEPADILEKYALEHVINSKSLHARKLHVLSELLDQICKISICFRLKLRIRELEELRDPGIIPVDPLGGLVNLTVRKSSQQKCPESHDNEFVIFSYNFGNYRNELLTVEPWLKRISLHGITAYFFTDEINFTPSIPCWHIVHVSSKMKDINGIPISRILVKRLKFLSHAELLGQYRYLIHVDSNAEKMKNLDSWLANGLTRFVKRHPEKSFFVQKHPFRETIKEEINALKDLSHKQPKAPLDAWDNLLMPQYNVLNQVQLPELHTWVLDTHDKSFSMKWSSIYSTLLQNGLWRDQIVYSFAIADAYEKVYMFERHNLFAQFQVV